MQKITVICDKCKKEIVHESQSIENKSIHIELPYMGMPLDFCEKCYTDLRLTIGSWIHGDFDKEEKS